MTVIQRPDTIFFAAECKDYIISSDSSITFSITQVSTGKQILKETYSPDTDGMIYIRELSTILQMCLYGVMECPKVQDHAVDAFQFAINDVIDRTSTVVMSNNRVPDIPATVSVLSRKQRDTAILGIAKYKNFIGNFKCTAYSLTGTALGTISDFITLNAGTIKTVNCDPVLLFPDIYENIDYIQFEEIGGTFTSLIKIDRNEVGNYDTFRYLNVFDLPETRIAKGGMSVKPSSSDTVSRYHGIDIRFEVEQTDEYTANSGALLMREEYAHWRDLLMSRKVDIFYNGEWKPILIKKTNYTHTIDKGEYSAIEFTFTMADPKDNGIITE